MDGRRRGLVTVAKAPDGGLVRIVIPGLGIPKVLDDTFVTPEVFCRHTCTTRVMIETQRMGL